MVVVVFGLEPPRGSGAHVSKSIPAVDDNRLGGVEPWTGGGVESVEGDVRRSGEVLLCIPFAGKDFENLRTIVEELSKSVTINPTGHGHLLLVSDITETPTGRRSPDLIGPRPPGAPSRPPSAAADRVVLTLVVDNECRMRVSEHAARASPIRDS
jgi:hypothetical protein